MVIVGNMPDNPHACETKCLTTLQLGDMLE